ncbi:MAG: alpha-glucosidase [Lachnospiraceae bacterium]|nr:alpha-glucosidase [Lachnospiraceae bacterium]
MVKWWKNTIVYQIYPKSFQDSNQDGIGDLRGIINRLDYIHTLGADTIWLCPINVSPMMDNGYDIADYYNIDPSFGSMKDLEELVEEAKKRGIKVLMDLVVNHCSSEHEWFKAAVADPNSRYASYFIIKETEGNVPNNMRCYNTTSAWERIGDSNLFYFHSFAKEQPDLNWENPELRREIIEMMKFWQKKGIVGFRIDAIGNLKKSPEAVGTRWIPTEDEDGMASMDQYVLMQDGIEVFLQELKDEVFDKYDMMTVAEVSVPEEKMEHYIGNDGLFSMVFDFTYTDIDVTKQNGKEWKCDWSLHDLKNRIYKSQSAIQKYGWGSPYLENHDQPRSVNKYIPEEDICYESKTALGAMFFFLRGTPFIYQGQEIGMENYPFSKITEFRDPFALERLENSMKKGENLQADLDYLAARGRDNGRIPMQWDDSPYAGFSDVEPWIAVNPDYRAINVKEEMAAEYSVFSFYQQMIRLRKDTEYGKTLTFGLFEAVESEYDSLISYKRKDEAYEITVLVNLGNQTLPLSEPVSDKKILLNNLTQIMENELLPYQAMVYATAIR